MFPLDPKLEGEKRLECPTDQGLGLEKSGQERIETAQRYGL